MHQAELRNRAIALIPVAALILAADLAQPGYGKFPNPLFYAKFAANAAQDKLSNKDSIDPSDARLSACKGETNTIAITDAQAALRTSLEGKSSSFAVQQLGSPACQLANGSYRWLLESGLAIDATANPDGTIDNVTLAR